MVSGRAGPPCTLGAESVVEPPCMDFAHAGFCGALACGAGVPQRLASALPEPAPIPSRQGVARCPSGGPPSPPAGCPAVGPDPFRFDPLAVAHSMARDPSVPPVNRLERAVDGPRAAAARD